MQTQNQMSQKSSEPEEIYKGLDRYLKLDKIGEGTYGIVYLAKDRISKKHVALKKIRLDGDSEGIPPTAIREISLLKELNHSCIVNLLDVVYEPEKLYLVFEYVDYDLKAYLDLNNDVLDEAVVRSFLYQLVSAIAWCHTRRILHRDLKPQNVLIDKRGNLKLADLGLGRAFGLPMQTYTHEIVTLWYRPPEILLGSKKYSGAVDIWGIGCIFAEMLNKKPLFHGDSEIDQIFRIFRILGTPSEKVWKGVSNLPDFKTTFPFWKASGLKSIFPALSALGLDLLTKMLEYDPSKRISALKALEHEYFSQERKNGGSVVSLGESSD